MHWLRPRGKLHRTWGCLWVSILALMGTKLVMAIYCSSSTSGELQRTLARIVRMKKTSTIASNKKMMKEMNKMRTTKRARTSSRRTTLSATSET